MCNTHKQIFKLVYMDKYLSILYKFLKNVILFLWSLLIRCLLSVSNSIFCLHICFLGLWNTKKNSPVEKSVSSSKRKSKHQPWIIVHCLQLGDGFCIIFALYSFESSSIATFPGYATASFSFGSKTKWRRLFFNNSTTSKTNQVHINICKFHHVLVYMCLQLYQLDYYCRNPSIHLQYTLLNLLLLQIFGSVSTLFSSRSKKMKMNVSRKKYN